MTTTHTSGATELLYLLRRLLSNRFTFTAPEFRKELQKIVEDAALAAGRAVAPADGWQQEGGHLYRLTDERHPRNRDEINVTMANGSRAIEDRARRALELLGCMLDNRPAPPAMGGEEDAEELRLLRALAFSVERAIGNGVMPLDIEEAYEGYDKWSAARAAQKEGE